MGVCGCFSFLEKGQDAAGKPLKPAGRASAAGAALSGAEAAVSCEAPRPEADPEDVASWRVGVQGVTDISPEGDGRLLLREPEGLPKEGCPADGAQAGLDLASNGWLLSSFKHLVLDKKSRAKKDVGPQTQLLRKAPNG